MKTRFNQLDGLRVLGVYSIMIYHTNEFFTIYNTHLVAGAGFFLLLVMSGYLFGYLHGDSYETYSIKDSFKCWFGKLKKFYPLHLITLLLTAILYYHNWFPVKEKIKVLLNMFLLQIYIPSEEYVHSLNGTSWYLAMILVVYFAAPFIAHLIFKVRNEKQYIVGISVCLFILAAIIFVCGNTTVGIWFSFILPIPYFFEFAIGVLFGKLCAEGEISVKKVEGVTLIVAIVLSVVLYFRGALLAILPTGLIVCVLILRASINSKGIPARILGNKAMTFLAGFSFDVYLFHQMIGKYVVKLGKRVPMNNYLLFTLTIVTSLVAAFIWNRFEGTIRKRITKARKES